MVDGGAYGVELAEELVGDDCRGGFWGFWGLECGGEVVEGENVGCYHCH